MRDLDQVLEAAGAAHGDGLVLLCSFQKEESLLIDSIVRYAPKTRIVTIDTGVLFPETLTAWKAFEDRFGVAVEVVEAKADPAWTGPEHCCSSGAKVNALEEALANVTGWVTGVRREQSDTRATAELVEHDVKRGIAKYNPLAFWSEKDIWREITARDLPYNLLHDQGFESIGCAPCTLPGSGREGRWAGLQKTECGLHV